MGLIEDYRTNRTKLIKTFILCFAYITLGYGIAIIGPVILDLSYLVKSTVSMMTLLLATRAIGTMISCFLTDFHKRYLSFEKILALSQFIMGITLFVLPFLNLIGMHFTIFVYGYASGCFQVFGDLWTIRIWNKKKAGIYIQWVYFFFSLGAFVAPLISAPFLSPAPKDLLAKQNGTKLTLNSTNATLSDEKSLTEHSLADLKVMYPFMIIGSYAILISVVLYIIDLTSKNSKTTKDDYQEVEGENNEEKNQIDNEKPTNSQKGLFKSSTKVATYKKINKKNFNESTSLLDSSEFKSASSEMPNITLIKVLSVLFVNLFIGFDVTFGTYLSAFVFINEDFGLSTQQGAFLTAAFWGAYTFAFRVPGYYIIQNYGPSILMNVEMIITFFSTILLSLLLVSNSLAVLWSSVVLEGLGMSIVYSTYLAYLKTKFEPSAKLASAFVCAFNIGSFLYPTVVGLYIEKYPIVFVYLSIFCCFATTFIYLYVRWLFRKWK